MQSLTGQCSSSKQHLPLDIKTGKTLCKTCPWFFWSSGHVLISNYLLNYFPGLDIERRNCHGFTALMKASMQGRADCVRSLMLAGKIQRKHSPLKTIYTSAQTQNLLKYTYAVLKSMGLHCTSKWEYLMCVIRWCNDFFHASDLLYICTFIQMLSTSLPWIFVSRRGCAGTEQQPQYDIQGVGPFHWSIRDSLHDVSADVEALCWAVLWLLLSGVAHAGG